MKRLLLLLLLCGSLAGTALADGTRSTTAPVEASMLVTGTIVVAPDGSVSSYAVDHPEKLPPAVVSVIGKNAPRWTFKPVLLDGKPVTAKASMNLRIVATPMQQKGSYTVAIRGASFGQGVPGESISKDVRTPPRYPVGAILDRVSGTVYLVVKVGRQGQVEDVAAEQVNLRVLGRPFEMARWRKELAEASVAAGRKWTFHPPVTGEHANDPYWIARIPIAFNIRPMGGPSPRPSYGQWQSYVPGPRALIPWLDEKQLAASAVDAVPAGGIEPLGSGMQLTSGLKGS